jgi:hypothetical protein
MMDLITSEGAQLAAELAATAERAREYPGREDQGKHSYSRVRELHAAREVHYTNQAR